MPKTPVLYVKQNKIPRGSVLRASDDTWKFERPLSAIQSLCAHCIMYTNSRYLLSLTDFALQIAFDASQSVLSTCSTSLFVL